MGVILHTIYDQSVEENERALTLGCPHGTVGVVIYSGWTDSDVFVQWLIHFVEVIKPTPVKKVLLFVNGHNSHKTLEAVKLALASANSVGSSPFHRTLLINSSRTTSASSDRCRSTTDRHATTG